MISINNPCDGGYVHEENGVRERGTTITQPEAAINARDRDHEQVVTTPLSYDQFLPITFANKDELPEGYEPLKKYIE